MSIQMVWELDELDDMIGTVGSEEKTLGMPPDTS